MYRIGGWRMAIGAAAPFNAYMIAKSPKTAAALRIVLWSFQVLLAVWLISMAAVAITAVFMKKKVDVRAPRVARPERTPRHIVDADLSK
jgi:cytidylate kinase